MTLRMKPDFVFKVMNLVAVTRLTVENRAQSGRGFPHPDEPDSPVQTCPMTPRMGGWAGVTGLLGV